MTQTGTARARTARTGGQIVVDALENHGVDRVFCVPGESYLPVLDALYDKANAIRTHACRHDGGAAYMAEAAGKLSGRPGVALVTRGPGAANAAIAVHVARQDSTPMLLLVGQVPRRHRGLEAFQEVDYREFFAPIAKHVEEAETTDVLPDALARAFHAAAAGRPGPAVLALPEDVLREKSDRPDSLMAVADGPAPDPAAMVRLETMLRSAERPILMIGGSVWPDSARADLAGFAKTNGLPVCCSFRRQDILDNLDPHYVGYLGLNADPKLFRRVSESDLLIVVGARLDEPTTRGYTLFDEGEGGPKIVHVHPDRAVIGRVFPAELGIEAAIPAFLKAAVAMKPADASRWHRHLEEARTDFTASLQPAAVTADGFADLGAIVRWLEQRLPDDAVITLDAGNFTAWPQRYLTYRRPGRLLAPINGAMGYGMPSAVAASLMRPSSVVVGFIGDGGMLMNGMELATAIQYGATPIIVVVNNDMYGTIRLHQEKSYPARPIATDLRNPDFTAMAQSFGAFARKVFSTEDFPAAFETALASGRAAVIEVITNPDILTPTFTIAGLQAKARA